MTRAILGFVLISILFLGCSPPPTATSTVVSAPTSSPIATSTHTPALPAVTQTNTTEAASRPKDSIVIFKIIPGESQASYEVGETFLNQNNRFNLAVGVTTAIQGEIEANLVDPPASRISPITVDISQLRSDSSRRDNYIRNNGLESARYPTATFVATRIEGLPTAYIEGQDYTFRITGNLTVREVTREVTFDVTARLEGQTLSGTATSKILMSDFGVGPIDLAGILRTEDEVKLTLRFIARP